MTRDEETEKAAKAYADSEDAADIFAYDSFLAGAKWERAAWVSAIEEMEKDLCDIESTYRRDKIMGLEIVRRIKRKMQVGENEKT